MSVRYRFYFGIANKTKTTVTLKLTSCLSVTWFLLSCFYIRNDTTFGSFIFTMYFTCFLCITYYLVVVFLFKSTTNLLCFVYFAFSRDSSLLFWFEPYLKRTRTFSALKSSQPTLMINCFYWLLAACCTTRKNKCYFINLLCLFFVHKLSHAKVG